jgi:hypothetical protein
MWQQPSPRALEGSTASFLPRGFQARISKLCRHLFGSPQRPYRASWEPLSQNGRKSQLAGRCLGTPPWYPQMTAAFLRLIVTGSYFKLLDGHTE